MVGVAFDRSEASVEWTCGLITDRGHCTATYVARDFTEIVKLIDHHMQSAHGCLPMALKPANTNEQL